MTNGIAQLSLQNAEAERCDSLESGRLMLPALLCIWMLPFVTFSPPDDAATTPLGTVPVLPPTVLKAMKLGGRGGAIIVMTFGLLSVWRHPKRDHVIGVMLPLLAFGTFGVLSTCWSSLKMISLQQSVTFCLLLQIALYVGIVWRSDRDSERIVRNLGMVVFGLTIVLLGLHFGMPRTAALTKNAAGILHSTNAGAAGGVGLLLLFAAKLLWNSPWSRWWVPIAGAELLMMLIASNRLSLAVTAVALLVLFALSLNRGIAGLFLLIAAIAVAGYVAIDPNLAFAEKAGKHVGVYARQGQTTSELGSVSGRAEMWEKMWQSYWDSPIIGHGFFVSTKKGRILVWQEWGNWTAHNLWLQVMVSVGLIGLFLLVIGLFVLAMGVLSSLRWLEDAESSAILLLVFAVWFAGWGFLNSSFVGPLQPESVVFAGLVGIAAGVASQAQWTAASAVDARSSRRIG